MLGSLHGCSAIVAGGASGLGKATAFRLWKNGANVIVADLLKNKALFQQNFNSELLRLQSEKALIEDAEHKMVYSETDVTKEEDVLRAIDLATSSQFGGKGLRVAVTCAGIGHAAKLFSKKHGSLHSLDDFQRVMSVNLMGTFNVMRLVAKSMSSNQPSVTGERGVIINTASTAAFDGQIGQTAYSASKGAIVSMTLPAARELAHLGIRVVAIAPGLFSTPLLELLPNNLQDTLGAMVPFPNRLGKPDEFAQLVEAIIANPMLNGETIRLDGALRMPP